ncbi:hypothetical protein KI387_013850, partial [Taxus chinensis]
MDEQSLYFSTVLGFILLVLSATVVETQKQPLISALYIFGDSTIDPGNNNCLATIAKANFPPYGRDFPNGQPTGRFTNGRLVTDLISELLGLPDLLPASLDPEFQGEKLLTGASFGSSGSGYADSTANSNNVMPLEKQVDNFKHYKAQLSNMVDQKHASEIVSEALFCISTGTDDFILNYYFNSLTRMKYSVQQFEDLLLQSLSGFIQNVKSEGGTRLAVIGLPPFGCLPSQITLHNLIGNTCVEEFNEVARSFNRKIKALVENKKLHYPGLRIAYIDIYNKLADMIRFPSKYGFEEVRKGCCGT